MSIKLRLILSYAAMLLIPTILTGILSVIILIHYTDSIGQDKNKADFFNELPERVIGTALELSYISTKDPDKLLDTSYLKSMDDRMLSINSGLAIVRGNKVYYISKLYNEPEIIKSLETSKGFQKSKHMSPYSHGLKYKSKHLATVAFDFVYSDNAAGKIVVISDLSPISIFLGSYFSTLMIAALIVLILTNGILTFIVSRSIIKPLNMLKSATQQIKEGNLDFQMKVTSRDEIGQVCLAFEDMRKKLKQSIETQIQYEENRKELISSISHDLKTPITAIKGYVEGIMDGVADSPEKSSKYIKTIYAKATDMDRLIDDLFLLSKLDLNKLPFNFEKVQLNNYFEDCIDEMKTDMEKRGVLISCSSKCPGDLMVQADRDKLKRVVTNIIENAVKYMDKEYGTIEIFLLPTQEVVNVEIRDNGRGICEKDLTNIFEKFYRADSSRNSTTGGSGLGLAIARQIIEGHGGRIWAESKSGEGTSVFFSLKIIK